MVVSLVARAEMVQHKPSGFDPLGELSSHLRRGVAVVKGVTLELVRCVCVCLFDWIGLDCVFVWLVCLFGIRFGFGFWLGEYLPR